MTKKDLIDKVHATLQEGDLSITKAEINRIVDKLFDKIKAEVSDKGKYSQPRFGTFETRDRKAREGRNPQDPTKKIKIPASKTVGFRVAARLKQVLNGE